MRPEIPCKTHKDTGFLYRLLIELMRFVIQMLFYNITQVSQQSCVGMIKQMVCMDSKYYGVLSYDLSKKW